MRQAVCHHPHCATLHAGDSTGPELAPKISDNQDCWWWCDAPHLCGVTSEGLWEGEDHALFSPFWEVWAQWATSKAQAVSC